MRRVTSLAAAVVAGALALTACGISSSGTSSAAPAASGSSAPASSAAAVIKVGMAYDVGGRGDQSFNDSAAAGLDKAAAEFGVETKEAAATNGEAESARAERLQQLIDAGYTNIVAVGFAYAGSVGTIAKENPDVKFAIVDDASEASTGANIMNITFAENEGSFLVGAAAALKSKSGKLGFVGGVVHGAHRFTLRLAAHARGVGLRLPQCTRRGLGGFSAEICCRGADLRGIGDGFGQYHAPF